MILLAFLAACFVGVFIAWLFRTKEKSPPGPRAIPFIGHLHLFAFSTEHPHKLFQKLSHRYGPIFSLRFGGTHVVVASTPDAAKEFLKTHDQVFASRPRNLASRIIMLECDLAFAPYGERWRHLRKLLTTELLSGRRLNIFTEVREREVNDLCNRAMSATGSIFDAREAFTSLSMNMMTTMLMSKRHFEIGSPGSDESKAFAGNMQRFVELGAQFAIGDHFHLLRCIDPVESQMKVVARAMHEFMNSSLVEREKQRDSSPNYRTSDYLDLLLDLRDKGDKHLQGPGVIIMMLNVIIGGSQTTAMTLEWTFAEIIKHPEVLAKAQQELESVVGRKRMVEESDIPKLEYLQAIVKESMRLHPIGPFLLPHESTQSCVVAGYTIPKNSMLLVNTYAIARDPSVWEDPEEFKPERFVGGEIDLKGQHFELIPFGAGRRICPGLNLALATIHLALANLMHMFDWKEADELKIDTATEHYGITVTMARKLQVVPVRRLPL